MKQFHDALLDFDEAEYFQAKVHGPNSHYDGEYVTYLPTNHTPQGLIRGLNQN